MRSLVTFILGDEEFAVHIEQIVCILDARKLGFDEGSTQDRPVIHMRNGGEAAILDLSLLLNIRYAGCASPKAYCLVLDCGCSYIAFLVGRINELLTLPEASVGSVMDGEMSIRNNVTIQHLRLGDRELKVLNPGGHSAGEWVVLVEAAAPGGITAQVQEDALPIPIEDRDLGLIGMRHEAPAPEAKKTAVPMNRNPQSASVLSARTYEDP